MKAILDMHTHTIASGHAYSSLEEMVQGAKRQGLKYIGITDHGPSMPGGPHIYHIGNQKVIPNIIDGVHVLKGVEANILNTEGELDLPDTMLEKLDIVIASLHDICISPSKEEDHTRASIKAMENPHVDILGHCGNPAFPIDKEAVVLKAKESNTLIEINNSSFLSSRPGSYENCKEIMELCKKHSVRVIMNTDSHISYSVGVFDQALELLESIDMPRELIINYSEKDFLDFLKSKNKKRFI